MLNVKERKAHILKSSKALVQWLLSMNTNNRPIRWSHVEWLVKAIEEGNFCLTGQGIGISKEGVLLDGQHRLIAIEKAEFKPVDLLVVTGLDEGSQIYVDQHAKRSTADMLKLALDQTVTSKMAAIAGFMVKMRQKDGAFQLQSGKPSLDEIVEYMSDNAENLGLITLAAGNKTRTGVISALYHYSQKYDANLAYALAEQIKNGEQLVKTDPAYRVRDYMMNRASQTGGSRILDDYMIGVSACVAHAQGRKMESIRGVQNWDQLPRRVRKAA